MGFRILSLNAWGGRLNEELIAYLTMADADVFCLQEIVNAPPDAPDWLYYRDGDLVLPQRAHLFDDICAALPGHRGAFFPAARGELSDHLHHPVTAEFGLATFVRRSHAVIAGAAGFIHGGFGAEGWGEHPRARNAHCFRVHDYSRRSAMTIAQLHGIRETSGKGDTPARARQTARLVSMIKTVWPGNEPLAVCGDFNVLPDSAMFETLGALGLNDLVTGGGHSDTRTSHYTKAGRFADYMLATADAGVLSFDVAAAPEVSDHRALVLDLA